MIRQWSEQDCPHVAAGGDGDGRIVSYWGSPRTSRGFNYCIPGLMSFLPMHLNCEAMIPITAAQANGIEEARRIARGRRDA